MQEDQIKGIPLSKGVVQADQQDDGNSTSCFSSLTVVLRAPTSEEPGPTEVPVILGICEAESRISPRVGLMGSQVVLGGTSFLLLKYSTTNSEWYLVSYSI